MVVDEWFWWNSPFQIDVVDNINRLLLLGGRGIVNQWTLGETSPSVHWLLGIRNYLGMFP